MFYLLVFFFLFVVFPFAFLPLVTKQKKRYMYVFRLDLKLAGNKERQGRKNSSMTDAKFGETISQIWMNKKFNVFFNLFFNYII